MHIFVSASVSSSSRQPKPANSPALAISDFFASIEFGFWRAQTTHFQYDRKC